MASADSKIVASGGAVASSAVAAAGGAEIGARDVCAGARASHLRPVRGLRSVRSVRAPERLLFRICEGDLHIVPMLWAGRLRLAAGVAAAVVVTVAAVLLALQAAGVLPVATTQSFGPLTIAPATAIVLLLGGVALALRLADGRAAAVLADVCAVAMLLVTVAGMFARRIGLMRPAYNTLVALVLVALGLLLLDRWPGRRRSGAQSLAVAGGTIAILAVAGYVFASPHLYQPVEHGWGMAAPTALGLLVLAAGMLCARPERGLMRPLTLDDVRGRTLRLLLPPLAAIPVIAFGLMMLARSEVRVLPTVAALLAGVGMIFATWLVVVFANLLAREAAVEERLRLVVDSTGDPIIDTEIDGTVRGWNRAAEQEYGWRADEILGKPIINVVPADARPQLLQMRAEVLADRRGRTYEGLRLRKDGSTFFAVTSLSPVCDASGAVTGIAAITHDLTPRLEAEAALKRAHASEQRRRRALERVAFATNAVSTALAALPKVPLPVLLQVFMEQACEAIGCDRAAVVERGGAILAERGSEPDAADAVTLELPLLARDQPVGMLRFARTRDRGEFTDEEQLIASLLAIRAAAAIEISRTYSREARERAWLTSAIDQIPDPVVLLDADARIKHVNPAALKLTRRPEGAVEGASSELVFELKRPSGETMPLAQSPLLRALRDREVVSGEEIRVGEGDAAVPMLLTAAPVVDGTGALLGAAMVARDISALKALERLREEWTSVVAHDLRQPVSVIHMTAQRLMTMCPPSNGEHDLLVRVERASKRLDRMIADLLDMSQLEARRLTLAPKAIDLRALVGETVRDLADVAAPHPIVLRVGEAPLPVSIDAPRIAQVIGNLVGNAAKYSEPESEIVVEVRRSDDSVEVAVHNRGRGIPADELQVLFERFRRSRATRATKIPGLGLGLFICKGLVEAHGGRIWAESVPGQTTTFRFTLPLAPSLPRSAAPTGGAG